MNNRQKLVVKDMKWTSDGMLICIIYEDGAIIIGSVEGSRVWGRELNRPLHFVEWSPSRQSILLGTLNGIEIFDQAGNHVKSLSIESLFRTQPLCLGEVLRNEIVGIHWHNGVKVEEFCPTLADACAAGRVRLSCGIGDVLPIFIITGMNLSTCRWSPNGSVLALCGTVKRLSDSRLEYGLIKFYSPHGQCLRTLKIPDCCDLSALRWDGIGLRVALAVNTSIYFANLRPDYMWGCLGSTIMYASMKVSKQILFVICKENHFHDFIFKTIIIGREL